MLNILFSIALSVLTSFSLSKLRDSSAVGGSRVLEMYHHSYRVSTHFCEVGKKRELYYEPAKSLRYATVLFHN